MQATDTAHLFLQAAVGGDQNPYSRINSTIQGMILYPSN